MSGRRTVVIGCGIAGILAAMAAAPHSDSVVLIERDDSEAMGEARKGIPQAHHAHTLLASGRAAIEAICPGVLADLLAAGANPVDFCADFAFFHFGVWKSRCTSAYSGSLQTRYMLERLLWQRLCLLPNVTLLSRTVVSAISLAGGASCVSGVCTHSLADRATAYLPCDLLIDASGRGSRIPNLLAGFGIAPPQEERLRLDLRYASAHYALPPQTTRPWQALLIYPKAPSGRRAGYIFATEENRYLVTLAGYFGDAPGVDHDAFLQFARTLEHHQIYHELQRSTPLTPVRSFRFLEQRRRRYDWVPGMPQGFIAVGDSVCTLDPLFGQGMSVAAAQAVTLGTFLTSGLNTEAAWQVLWRDLIKPTTVPWLLTSSEAFRYPEVEGRRSPLHRLLQWYAARVFVASASDATVYQRFMGLMHLTSSLHSVCTPRTIAAVIKPTKPAAAIVVSR